MNVVDIDFDKPKPIPIERIAYLFPNALKLIESYGIEYYDVEYHFGGIHSDYIKSKYNFNYNFSIIYYLKTTDGKIKNRQWLYANLNILQYLKIKLMLLSYWLFGEENVQKFTVFVLGIIFTLLIKSIGCNEHKEVSKDNKYYNQQDSICKDEKLCKERYQ